MRKSYGLVLLLLLFPICLTAQNRTLRDLSCSATSGSGTAYACSFPVAVPSPLLVHELYGFWADVANTGPASINFQALGAKTIKKQAGGVTTDLAANDIRAGQFIELRYDGTNMQMLSQLGNAAAGGGGGASAFSQLTDYGVANTSGPVQQMGAGCSSAAPCQIGVGAAQACLITAPVNAALSGTTVGGVNQAWWYCSAQGNLTIGHNTTSTIACPAPCNVATGITGFPADSVPLWNTNFTSLTWNTIVPATMDRRAVLRNTVIAAGSNMTSSIDPSTGIQTLSAVVPGAVVSGVDRQSFPVGYGGAATYSLVSDSNNTTYQAVATGPNSLAYHNALLILAVNDWLVVSKKASTTWSGAAGTIDINLSEQNIDGPPAAGSWNLNFYVGCAAPGASFTYGSANTIAVTPGSAGFSSYSAPGITFPVSCAAGRPMQFWLQRVADTGGATGVRPGVSILEVVIRGN